MARTAVLVSLGFGLALVFGCGDAKKCSIAGTVTLDGKPVVAGDIIFRPAAPGSQPIRAEIKEGKYSVTGPVDKMKAEITARRETDRMDSLGGKAYEQYIPSRYNDHTTLEIDVQPSRAITFNFDLTSQPAGSGTSPPTPGF